jgi:hypothetical protein
MIFFINLELRGRVGSELYSPVLTQQRWRKVKIERLRINRKYLKISKILFNPTNNLNKIFLALRRIKEAIVPEDGTSK